MPDLVYKAKITTITPMHIGSGKNDLIANYDFVADGSKIWVIDHEKMFETVSDEVFNKEGADAPINKLLKQKQYEQCSKYSLNNLAGVKRIIDQIKNAYNRPYIPGSSIKGAIRTALMYAMVEKGIINIKEVKIGGNSKEAGKNIEKSLFGENPNSDVMRALQISDTEAVNAIALDSVVLYSVVRKSNSEVLAPKEPKTEYTFPVEVIPQGTELSFSIKIDSYLFDDKNSRKLGFDIKRDWITNFVEHCNSFAHRIIDNEIWFYNEYKAQKIRSFYERLNEQFEKMDLKRQFLLHISWGTGWSSKTIGLALDDDIYNTVIDKFNLDKGRKTVFPKTRRIIERGNLPEMPLGWVKVDLS